MARKEEKNNAIKLRKQGMSYSQIKEKLGINKGTLSSWLSGMPLSKSRLYELQKNELVIEKIRAAKLITRTNRLDEVRKKVTADIGILSKRELFIAGFFFYWAEGGKTSKYTVTLSNSDPRMIRSFIEWLILIGVPKEKIHIRLHLYIDMDEVREIKYWVKELKLSKNHFGNSYIKKSKLSELTYLSRGHGTCNAMVNGRDISEYVLQGQDVIAGLY